MLFKLLDKYWIGTFWCECIYCVCVCVSKVCYLYFHFKRLFQPRSLSSLCHFHRAMASTFPLAHLCVCVYSMSKRIETTAFYVIQEQSNWNSGTWYGMYPLLHMVKIKASKLSLHCHQLLVMVVLLLLLLLLLSTVQSLNSTVRIH